MDDLSHCDSKCLSEGRGRDRAKNYSYWPREIATDDGQEK